MNNISTLPLLTGFETEGLHYYEKTLDRVIFNAFRIVSYIPIIAIVGLVLKNIVFFDSNIPSKMRKEKYNIDIAEPKLTLKKLDLCTISSPVDRSRVQIEIDKESRILEANVLIYNETVRKIEETRNLYLLRIMAEVFGLGVAYLPFDIYATVSNLGTVQ